MTKGTSDGGAQGRMSDKELTRIKQTANTFKYWQEKAGRDTDMADDMLDLVAEVERLREELESVYLAR